MSGWENWLGRTQVQHDVLSAALVARYRATLDANCGDTVPQGLHWCLCLPEAATASLGEDGHPLRHDDKDSFLPPVPLPRRMWASSQVSFHQPLHLGTQIERRSTIANISEKSGSTGALVFVDVQHETWANGGCAIEETQTLVYREAATGAPMSRGEDVDVDVSDWHWHRALMPTTPLLFRYSALTFNSHRIHYDLPYAVEVERYRGLVVHGPLMASLLLDHASRALGENSLSSFNFRGASPAFAQEPLHLVGKQEGSAISLAVLGADGRTVMTADATRL